MYQNALILFEKEFWKDSRNILVSKDGCILRKYYSESLELDTEVKILNHLKRDIRFFVPEITGVGNTYSEMRYYKGIRVFNLLVEIDEFSKVDPIKSKNIKWVLLEKCEKEQKALQEALSLFLEKDSKIVPYPFSKIQTAIEILKLCLDIKCNSVELNKELEQIYEIYKKDASVPFRDATTKNMIFACDELHLNAFNSIEERRKYLFKLFAEDSIIEKILLTPIINFDFSSCINTTTIEDDYISLKYHERTWDGKKPVLSSLNWANTENSYRAATTFIIRFLRFGGRKAAYKILHRHTANIRFKYDDPCFYFKMLPLFLSEICPQIIYDFPNVIQFVSEVNTKINSNQYEADYFLEAGLGKNEKSYLDVFPN